MSSHETRWVEEALVNLDLSDAQARKVLRERGTAIAERARSRFVVGDPRTWWLSLQDRPVVHEYDYTTLESALRDILAERAEERCWLVVDEESDGYSVFDCETTVVPAIIMDCPHLEYYLVGKGFGWLVIDTEHYALLLVVHDSGEECSDVSPRGGETPE